MLMNAELWVLVAFLIFFGVFGGKIWGALAAMLDSRAESIRIELAQAAKLRAEAEQMLREAQTARQAALDEARDIMQRGRAEAVRIAEAAHAEAEAAGARRERMALDRIKAAEKAAVSDVRQMAAEIAAVAARAVIANTLTPQEDEALIDNAISGMPQALRAA